MRVQATLPEKKLPVWYENKHKQWTFTVELSWEAKQIDNTEKN